MNNEFLKFDPKCYPLEKTLQTDRINSFEAYRPFLRVVKRNDDEKDLVLRICFFAEKSIKIDNIKSDIIKQNRKNYIINIKLSNDANLKTSDDYQIVQIEIGYKEKTQENTAYNKLIKAFFKQEKTVLIFNLRKFLKVNIISPSSTTKEALGFMRISNEGGGSHDRHPFT